MKRNILLLILIITSLGIFLIGCSSEPDSEEDLYGEKDLEEDEVEDDIDLEEDEVEEEEPVMAPELITLDENGEEILLKNLAGEEVSLEDYRGKIIFLNFWATWCPHCIDEMPDFQRLENANDDVKIIAVDVMEDQALVEDYIKEGGYDFEVVLDTEGRVANTYLISAFPTTYVIAEDGTISRWFPGRLTYEQMEELLHIAREDL